MLYIVLLFIFNIFIIIVLANVKSPSANTIIRHLSKYHLDKPMMLQNHGALLDEIEINRYHSININFEKDLKDEAK